jgi:hypothetical protein
VDSSLGHQTPQPRRFLGGWRTNGEGWATLLVGQAEERPEAPAALRRLPAAGLGREPKTSVKPRPQVGLLVAIHGANILKQYLGNLLQQHTFVPPFVLRKYRRRNFDLFGHW